MAGTVQEDGRVMSWDNQQFFPGGMVVGGTVFSGGIAGAAADGVTDDSAAIQAVIDAVRPVATLAKPRIIYIPPGLYQAGTTINATNLTGVRFVGGGAESTIIRATKGWITSNASGGGGFHGLFDVSGCNDVVFDNLQVDGVFGDDGTIGFTANALSGILHDNMLGNLMIRNSIVRGGEYCVSAGANANAATRVDIMNSRLLGNMNCVRGGAEKWHIFSSDIRGTATDTGFSQTANPSGVQFLGTGEFQVWGCHIHAEDQRATAGNGHVVAVRPSAAGSSGQFIGCTLHVDILHDGAGTYAGVHLTSNISTTVIFVGCDVIYETPVMTGGVIGAISTIASTSSAATLRFTSCNFRDNGGSGGTHRGWLVRPGGTIVNAGPTIDVSGCRYLDGADVPTTQITLTGQPATQPSASTTLVSGTKAVILLTDAGTTSDTTAVFTNGSASVTGGTAFTTNFKTGQFIRLTTDTDANWARIKNIASASAITLEETYLGTGGTGTARKGTPNVNTQNDSNYRVLPVLTTAVNETLNISVKRPGFFVVNSSNAASTATLDWTLTRQ